MTFHSTLKIFCWHLLCCVSFHITVTLQAVCWKGSNQLKLGEKTAEIWCGELHQLRKFLFFWDQRQLWGKERLYILVRMKSGVETSEYC